MSKTKLMLGDNIESLKKLPDNSVDSIVTDPPYALTSIKKRFGKEGSAPAQYGTDGAFQRASKGFMGKEWDAEVPTVEFWREVYRVLKPGGHVLSFGGTRTYHRMVVNIEDAGFEIRDQIMWLYGSGFPKSRNIGKDIEKINVGGLSNLKQIGTKKGTVATNHHELATKDKPKGFSYKTASHTLSHSEVATARTQTTGDIPVYEINNEYDGWGTALKPANEPICVARKPLSEKSVAENVLRWGTGGINIDGCRVKFDDKDTNPATNPLYRHKNADKYKQVTDHGQKEGVNVAFTNSLNPPSEEGRFPANIILDEIAGELLDEQTGYLKSGEVKPHHKKNKTANGYQGSCYGKFQNEDTTLKGYGDGGGASRFFYQAKVSKAERNMGLDGFEETTTGGKGHGLDRRCSHCNTSMLKPEDCKCEEPDWITPAKKNSHPTVKPVSLMAYLCRLVTPPNGIVLDPFMGSGSTGIAARLEGFKFLGMEMDKDYFKIAESRIENFEEYRKFIK